MKNTQLGEPRHIVKYDHHSGKRIFARLFSSTVSLTESKIFYALIGSFIGAVFFLMPAEVVTCLFILLGLIGLVLVGVVSVDNTAIVADHRGITLPLVLLRAAKGKTHRAWSELQLVMFTRDERSTADSPEQLVLGFVGNETVELQLDGMSKDGLERLLLAITTYCPEAEMIPKNALEKLNLRPGDGNRSLLSYTGLWKSDLSERFGSTVVVPLDSGDTLQNGRIKIIGQIAFGGLSAVYLAEDKNKSTVVVKEAILPGLVDDILRTKSLEMFQREAKLLAAINHPRIAKVLDYFVEDSRHFMILEHIIGKNLRTFVEEKGPQSERLVFMWAGELTDILVYLHSRTPVLLHRDLTPENLLLERDGSLTLIDFGAANLFIGTATGTVVGKSAYIPMEQFKGKACPASDIYAFGGTMYYLLTGRDPEPFSESSPRAEGVAVTADFDRLIADCTKVDASDRINDAIELKQRLKEVTNTNHGQSALQSTD